MIIHNNFDNKRALPTNNDYQKIGKGFNNMNKDWNDKPIIKSFSEIDEDNDRENDEEEMHDKWGFFK